MIDNLIKEALNFKGKITTKESVDEILKITLGKITNYSKYKKPSIKKLNRKRIDQIEKNFDKKQFLKDLQRKMKNKFYKDFEIEIDPFENFKNIQNDESLTKIKDSLIEEMEELKKKEENSIYLEYLKEEIDLNLFQLKFEKINNIVNCENNTKIDFFFIDNDQKTIYFVIDENKYFQSKGNKNLRKKTIDSKITAISYLNQNDLFITCYENGIVEVFKIGFFNLRYIEANMKISQGSLYIFPLDIDNECKFLINTASGCIVLVEVKENSFGLEISKKVVLKNFFAKENSVCIKTLQKVCFAILQNKKGFIIILLDPQIKKIFEFKIQEKNNFFEDFPKENPEEKNGLFFLDFFQIQKLENGDFFLTFSTYYYDELIFYDFFYNIENEKTILKIKQKFFIKFDLLSLNTFNKNLIVGITSDFYFLYFNKSFEIIGKSKITKKISQIKKFENFYIFFTKNEKTKETSIFSVKTYQIEDYVKKLITAGDYLTSLNLSLKFLKNESDDFSFLKNYENKSEMNSLLINVCKSYFKFLIYSKPIEELDIDSFGVLIEFVIKSGVLTLINEFYEEIDSSLPQNIDYISEAIIIYCTKNGFYEINVLSENWVNKIIEKAFLQNRKYFLLKLLEKIDFGKFMCLDKIIQFLKIMRLKFPLFKLIFIENVYEYKILEALLKIYISEKKIRLFTKVCLKIIKKNSFFDFKIPKVSFETENFIINFFLQKDIIEIFSEYYIEYSQIFVNLYYPYFENWQKKEITFSSFNNSLIYNYFCLKQKVEKAFEIFVYAFEHYAFINTKKIDQLFAVVIIFLFIYKKLQIENYNIDFFDIIMNILLTEIDDKKKEKIEKILLDLFTIFKKHKDIDDIAFKIFFNKYKKIARLHSLYKLEMALLTIEKLFEEALNVFLNHHKAIKNFDIFEWCKKVIIQENPNDLQKLKMTILKNLETLIYYSKKKTSCLLCNLNNITLKDLDYLEAYPEFVITIIQREMKNNNLIDFVYQEKMLNELQKINPYFLINPIKKFNFDLEKTKKLILNSDDHFALIVLENKMGRFDNLIDIVLKQIKIYVNTSSKDFNFKEKQLLFINFLYEEFADVFANQHETKFFLYCFSEIFKIINKNVHLNDYDYFYIVILTHKYFLKCLSKIKKTDELISLQNLDYFLNLNRSLLQTIMKNIENENTFLSEFLNAKFQDIRTFRYLNFLKRKNGICSSKLGNFVFGNQSDLKFVKLEAISKFEDFTEKNSFLSF